MPATGVLASNGTLPTTQPLKLKPTLNGHTANSTSDRLQIIDNEKQFTFVYVQGVCGLVLISFCRSSLNDQISAWNLRDVGFDYNLVAVFGSQSTGKSTPFSHALSNKVSILLMQVLSSIGYSAPTSMSWMRRNGNRRQRVSSWYISDVTPTTAILVMLDGLLGSVVSSITAGLPQSSPQY